MSPSRKHLVHAVLFLSAFVAVASAPSALAAPKENVPCWKRLLNDWYDGTINNTYPLPCYDQAIKHLPTEVQVYSSAKDDILAARQAAANHQPPPKETSSPSGGSTTTTATTSSTTTTATTPGSTGAVTTTAVPTTTIPVTTTPDANPPKKKHGLPGLLADITPGDPQSFPLPLLVLGALAILLVLAGGAGMLWQRSHPRDSDAQ